MTRMIFVRHGQSLGNLERRFYGQTDGPLTDLGREQAGKTAEYLKDTHIDAAYSSDLSRAYETGKIIAAPHNIEVTPCAGLREIFAGDWENLLFTELLEKYKETFGTWCLDLGNSCPDNGESVKALAERIRAEVWKIAAENDGKTVLLAIHATPIRALACEWCHAPIEKMQEIGWVRNASVSIVDYDCAAHKTAVQLYDEASFMGDIATSLPRSV
ncbi:MAG: histidine phosphatase family protein [Clostridia bacterium]|nr:histidine phosphatase family protein [Clostridia bacterium]